MQKLMANKTINNSKSVPESMIELILLSRVFGLLVDSYSPDSQEKMGFSVERRVNLCSDHPLN